jgi:sialic acid synthase SpsE
MTLTELFENREPWKIVRPYIIAEAGVNHEGSMDTAKRLIHEAKEGGADAVKFQAYKADTLASKQSPAYWDLTQEPTTSQHTLFAKHDSFWKNEFEALKRVCDDTGIDFLCTPFDIESADFLNDLVPAFKIASADITCKPFLQYIGHFCKPVILSTGASYIFEVADALRWLRVPTAILHCVLNYPAPCPNIGMIVDLKRKFPDCPIGYSDHTLPNVGVLTTAVMLGARIIEKHFTHDKTLPGNDHYHAITVTDLWRLNAALDKIFLDIGDHEKHPLPSEEPARLNARRSLIAKRPIPKGKEIENDDVTWKRPGDGISPRFIGLVIGGIALEDIPADATLTWRAIY